jgi:hypothetical protein
MSYTCDFNKKEKVKYCKVWPTLSFNGSFQGNRLCSRTDSAGDGEEQYISLCFRYVFAGANHQDGFSPVAGLTQ